MKASIDKLISNSTFIILFVGLMIETKEIFSLDNADGRHIDAIYLFWATPITVILFISLLYALIRHKPQIVRWIALSTFISSAILTTIVYLEGHGEVAIIFPIFSLVMMGLTINRIKNEITAANNG
jgi:hypothetical protein